MSMASDVAEMGTTSDAAGMKAAPGVAEMKAASGGPEMKTTSDAFSQPAGKPTPRPRRLGAEGRRWPIQTVEPPEQEGWLLTYLDVITLLLVMMVVLLSFSGPGGQAPSAQIIFDSKGARISGTGPPSAENGAAPDRSAGSGSPSSSGADPGTPQAASADPPASGLAGLDLGDLGKDIQVSVEQGIVRFRINSEIMFDSAQAGLVGQGRTVLESLLTVLRRTGSQRIIVEGHTDSLPIQTERFPSNWELSSARASSVARYLIDNGIAPTRIRVSGLADTQPIADNRDATSRAANRRVELILETVR
jgi:chemotaxis protein MotB